MAWVFAAYAIVWLAFFLYLVSLDKKQKAIADEIADLSSKLGGETDG